MEILFFLIPTLILLALLSKFEWKDLAKNLPKIPPPPKFPPRAPLWQKLALIFLDVIKVITISLWQICKFSLRCALAISGIKKPS